MIKGRKLSDNRGMKFHCSKPSQGPHSEVWVSLCMQIVTLIQAGQPSFWDRGNFSPCSGFPCPWLCSLPPLGVQSDLGPSQARRRHRNRFAPFSNPSPDWGLMIFMTPYNWWYAGAYLMEVASWQARASLFGGIYRPPWCSICNLRSVLEHKVCWPLGICQKQIS